MAQTVRAVVAVGAGRPVEVRDVVVPDPGPGEATVRVLACGLCHTDLHYRDGVINDNFPFLLGHEAAGIVDRIGDGVENVAPGDFVILNWRALCGRCRPCRRGTYGACLNERVAGPRMTLTTGEPLGPALGIGALAELTLVDSGQCTPVDKSVDPAAVCLLGCGVMAGLGAATNTGGVTTGDWVTVIGCGGVGSAAIAGARLSGASRIIAVDLNPRRLEMARDFGATDVVNPNDHEDLVDVLRRLTDGLGADVVIDAAGTPETWRQGFYSRAIGGTFVLVARPDSTMRLELPLLDAFLHGGTYKTSWYGDCLPSRDFPALVDLYKQGRLPLERFVSERIALTDVEESFTRMRRGDVLRSVVIFD